MKGAQCMTGLTTTCENFKDNIPFITSLFNYIFYSIPFYSTNLMIFSKLLGVTSDQHLQFNALDTNIRAYANRRCHGLLVLNQSGCQPVSLVQLYTTQVIPTIAYSAPDGILS